MKVQNQATKAFSNQAATWLDQKNHRAHSYKQETRAGLTPTIQSLKLPFWLTLNIPSKTQQRIFERRTLATDLATHVPSRLRTPDTQYEESYCPLCSNIRFNGKTFEFQESFFHFTMDCPHLQAEQDDLESTAQHFFQAKGGIILTRDSPPSPWSALPTTAKLALLMGNKPAFLKSSFPDKPQRQEWLGEFLTQTGEPLRKLWTRRKLLITEIYTAH